MGFLDRLRGRRDERRNGSSGDGGGSSTVESAGEGSLSGGTTGSGGSTTSTTAPVGAAWLGLPPIQRATGDGPTGVADTGFGGRLPTWQNPSFTGAPSLAILNPASGGSLLSAVLPGSARPAAGREGQAQALSLAAPAGEPVGQGMPVAPLRATPAATASPTRARPAATPAAAAPSTVTPSAAVPPTATPSPAAPAPPVQRSRSARPTASTAPVNTPAQAARGVRVTPVPPAPPRPGQPLTKAPSGPTAVQRRALPATRRGVNALPEPSGTAPSSADDYRGEPGSTPTGAVPGANPAGDRAPTPATPSGGTTTGAPIQRAVRPHDHPSAASTRQRNP
ncbi:hypothetical protein ABZZ80_42660, partial [Streptomyces sp. NPDC006356]